MNDVLQLKAEVKAIKDLIIAQKRADIAKIRQDVKVKKMFTAFMTPLMVVFMWIMVQLGIDLYQEGVELNSDTKVENFYE